jgi:hypothetical protein
MANLWVKIKKSLKHLPISSFSVYYHDKEVELDYMISSLQVGTSKDNMLSSEEQNKDAQTYNENQTIRIAYFIPIFMTLWADKNETPLEVLAMSCKHFQVCKLYTAVTPEPNCFREVANNNPIIKLACDHSVFVNGLSVYGPVPNLTGIQGFCFHFKIYKLGEFDKSHQYVNFSVKNMPEGYCSVLFD